MTITIWGFIWLIILGFVLGCFVSHFVHSKRSERYYMRIFMEIKRDIELELNREIIGSIKKFHADKLSLNNESNMRSLISVIRSHTHRAVCKDPECEKT